MKKIIFVILISMSFLTGVKAAEYTSETLKEACTKESLTCEHKRENQSGNPNVYIFRGDGCGFCQRLLTYMSTIIDDYKVNVVVYQVKGTSGAENLKLYRKVGEVFDFDATSYPYMVIGKETFLGYDSSDNENIKAALKKLEETKDPYDVVNEVKDKPDVEVPEEQTDTTQNTETYTSNTTSESKESNESVVVIFIFGTVVTLLLIMGYKFVIKEQ